MDAWDSAPDQSGRPWRCTLRWDNWWSSDCWLLDFRDWWRPSRTAAPSRCRNLSQTGRYSPYPFPFGTYGTIPSIYAPSFWSFCSDCTCSFSRCAKHSILCTGQRLPEGGCSSKGSWGCWAIGIHLGRGRSTSVHAECIGHYNYHYWYNQYPPWYAKCAHYPTKRCFRGVVPIAHWSHRDNGHPRHITIHREGRNFIDLILGNPKQKRKNEDTQQEDSADERKGRILKDSPKAKDYSRFCPIQGANAIGPRGDILGSNQKGRGEVAGAKDGEHDEYVVDFELIWHLLKIWIWVLHLNLNFS